MPQSAAAKETVALDLRKTARDPGTPANPPEGKKARRPESRAADWVETHCGAARGGPLPERGTAQADLDPAHATERKRTAAKSATKSGAAPEDLQAEAQSPRAAPDPAEDEAEREPDGSRCLDSMDAERDAACRLRWLRPENPDWTQVPSKAYSRGGVGEPWGDQEETPPEPCPPCPRTDRWNPNPKFPCLRCWNTTPKFPYPLQRPQ